MALPSVFLDILKRLHLWCYFYSAFNVCEIHSLITLCVINLCVISLKGPHSLKRTGNDKTCCFNLLQRSVVCLLDAMCWGPGKKVFPWQPIHFGVWPFSWVIICWCIPDPSMQWTDDNLTILGISTCTIDMNNLQLIRLISNCVLIKVSYSE